MTVQLQVQSNKANEEAMLRETQLREEANRKKRSRATKFNLYAERFLEGAKGMKPMGKPPLCHEHLLLKLKALSEVVLRQQLIADSKLAKTNLRQRKFDLSPRKDGVAPEMDHVIVDGQLVEQARPYSKTHTRLDEAISRAQRIKSSKDEDLRHAKVADIERWQDFKKRRTQAIERYFAAKRLQRRMEM